MRNIKKVFVYQDLVDYSDKICVIYDETTDEMVAFYIDEESEKDLVPQTKHQDSHYDLDKKILKLDKANIPAKSKVEENDLQYSDVYQS